MILTRAWSSSGALSPIDITLLKEEHLLISRGIAKTSTASCQELRVSRRTSMNALLAFLLSVRASLLSYTLIMVWYIVPHLSKQPRVQALLPVLAT